MSRVVLDRHATPACRQAALFFSACLVTHATGCASAAVRAREAWSHLTPGMTAGEVRERIGSPSKSWKVDPDPRVAAQTVDVWLYSYSGSEITPAEVAAGVLLLAAAFAVAAIAIKGGGGGLGGLGGGGGKGRDEEPSRYRFYVGFGRDGRVREVTMVEPVR